MNQRFELIVKPNVGPIEPTVFLNRQINIWKLFLVILRGENMFYCKHCKTNSAVKAGLRKNKVGF
ncbi:hypothetical protein K9M79_09110, partial [Candidatus Woesearchaeota archaeon]|nr:hypothetical protein [Candidatus Woesearchaeota archaeon]